MAQSERIAALDWEPIRTIRTKFGPKLKTETNRLQMKSFHGQDKAVNWSLRKWPKTPPEHQAKQPNPHRCEHLGLFPQWQWGNKTSEAFVLHNFSTVSIIFALFCFVVYWWTAVNDKRLKASIWNGDQQSLWCLAMRLKAADYKSLLREEQEEEGSNFHRGSVFFFFFFFWGDVQTNQ